jgi:transcriptional/translational regulatory protein YebC/TACO1
VKSGGPDPVSNSKLNDLLKQAKVLGVPKDVIDRNIKRASDAKQGDYQECIYEAYGPAGTGEAKYPAYQ